MLISLVAPAHWGWTLHQVSVRLDVQCGVDDTGKWVGGGWEEKQGCDGNV